jgi:hypothetical protein
VAALSAVKPRGIDEETGYNILLEKARKIKPGNSYVFEAEKSEHALKTWDGCGKNGFREKFKRLAIYGRTRPLMLEELGMFSKEDARWFTTNYVEGEICLNPTNIAGISKALKDDVSGKKAILVDGMEYLASQNNFEIVLRLVHHVNDNVQGSGSAVVWTYDPTALGKKESHQLKKDAADMLA